MMRLIYSLMIFVTVAGLSAFTTNEKVELKAEKVSVIKDVNGTFLTITLNTEKVLKTYLPEQMNDEQISKFLISLTDKHLRVMVRYPDCETGWTIAHEPVGTNFVKNTCYQPAQNGGSYVSECFSYSPYTSSWHSVACWPS